MMLSYCSGVRSCCQYYTFSKRFLRLASGTFEQLTKTEVDNILRQNERRVVINSGAILSYETNQLGANKPCEDHYSEAFSILSKSWLFGVFDGHNGNACSNSISSTLFDYMILSLLTKEVLDEINIDEVPSKYVQWFHRSAGELDTSVTTTHRKNLMRFFEFCKNNRDKLANVKSDFQASFMALDQDMMRDAFPPDDGKASLPHLSAVLAGSCACVAHVRGPNLHVANVGDSIAVLGICNEGSWHARQITKEHCIENADEVKRIRAEHPAKESGTILKSGRLLGQLYPLRAFGDAKFKWTAEEQRQIALKLRNSTENVSKLQSKLITPSGLESPPYLISRPEVLYHRLTPNDKFLVIASDGLWELLNHDRVVRLISDHLVGRETLNVYSRTPGANVGAVFEDLRNRKLGEDKRPEDENSATHLIRQALGGSGQGYRQFKELNAMLSLPQGVARSYRDDITVTIIYFNSDYIRSEAR